MANIVKNSSMTNVVASIRNGDIFSCNDTCHYMVSSRASQTNEPWHLVNLGTGKCTTDTYSNTLKACQEMRLLTKGMLVEIIVAAD